MFCYCAHYKGSQQRHECFYFWFFAVFNFVWLIRVLLFSFSFLHEVTTTESRKNLLLWQQNEICIIFPFKKVALVCMDMWTLCAMRQQFSSWCCKVCSRWCEWPVVVLRLALLVQSSAAERTTARTRIIMQRMKLLTFGQSQCLCFLLSLYLWVFDCMCNAWTSWLCNSSLITVITRFAPPSSMKTHTHTHPQHSLLGLLRTSPPGLQNVW